MACQVEIACHVDMACQVDTAVRTTCHVRSKLPVEIPLTGEDGEVNRIDIHYKAVVKEIESVKGEKKKSEAFA
jgi:hypothetical protein